MNTLPDKPSELIRVALEDLNKCEADDRFIINMGTWYDFDGEVCEVCFAGAVMAQTLGNDPVADERDILLPASFEKDPILANKLRSLEYFRRGLVGLGLHFMGSPEAGAREVTVADYEIAPRLFAYDMNALADTLEAEGL